VGRVRLFFFFLLRVFFSRSRMPRPIQNREETEAFPPFYFLSLLGRVASFGISTVDEKQELLFHLGFLCLCPRYNTFRCLGPGRTLRVFRRRPSRYHGYPIPVCRPSTIDFFLSFGTFFSPVCHFLRAMFDFSLFPLHQEQNVVIAQFRAGGGYRLFLSCRFPVRLLLEPGRPDRAVGKVRRNSL